jgi:hypothetical protein
VDFEPNADQQSILEAVAALLAQHAGAKRATQLNRTAAYDGELDAALEAAGFQGVALADGAGLLEAALVVEAVAKAGGVVGIGASALVAPALAGRALPGPIALAREGDTGPVRFAAHARTLLVDAGEEARLRTLAGGDASPVVRTSCCRWAASAAGRSAASRWATARGSGCAASGVWRWRPRRWGRWRPASR